VSRSASVSTVSVTGPASAQCTDVTSPPRERAATTPALSASRTRFPPFSSSRARAVAASSAPSRRPAALSSAGRGNREAWTSAVMSTGPGVAFQASTARGPSSSETAIAARIPTARREDSQRAGPLDREAGLTALGCGARAPDLFRGDVDRDAPALGRARAPRPSHRARPAPLSSSPGAPSAHRAGRRSRRSRRRLTQPTSGAGHHRTSAAPCTRKVLGRSTSTAAAATRDDPGPPPAADLFRLRLFVRGADGVRTFRWALESRRSSDQTRSLYSRPDARALGPASRPVPAATPARRPPRVSDRDAHGVARAHERGDELGRGAGRG
jgi:hypothetical protein